MDFARTNKTDLTDDELMLFDALFDHWCFESGLRSEKFGELHNFPYKHTLSDERLLQVLDNLHKRKLIKSRKGLHIRKDKGIKIKTNSFTLTSEGGKLWSLERNPDWNKYCINPTVVKLEGSTVETLSPSRQTLEEHVNLERDLLYNELGVSIKVTFKTLEHYHLTPWKRFSKIYAASWFEPFCLIRESEWMKSDCWRKTTNSWSSVNDLLEELK